MFLRWTMVDYLKRFFFRIGYQIYGERHVYELERKSFLKQGRIIEFVGPSGSGKTTNLNLLFKVSKKLRLRKKKYVTEYNHKIKMDEITLLDFYMGKLFKFRIKDSFFSKNLISLVRKFFFTSYLLQQKKVFITDEGLYKLFLINITEDSDYDQIKFFNNVNFVFFFSDIEAILKNKFHNVHNALELLDIQDNLKRYFISMLKFKEILDFKGIEYLIIDGFDDQSINLKKIERFILEVIEYD